MTMLTAGIFGTNPFGELVTSIVQWCGRLVVRRACAVLKDLPAAAPDGGEWTQDDADVLAGVIAAADWLAARKAKILDLCWRPQVKRKHYLACAAAAASFFGRT